MKKGKITGIGGIFFKCKNPETTKEWYRSKLGLKTDKWGAPFEFRQEGRPHERAFAQWSTFPDNTRYFDPSTHEFMINYRVENIEAFVDELKAKGVIVCDAIEEFDYGKFVHILDGDGRKIELWEPIDKPFADMYPEDATNK